MTELVRVAIRVPAAEREEAIARLLALVPQGFDERPVAELVELVELGAYVDRAAAGTIRASFPQSVVEPVAAGWEDRWREFHHGVTAGGLWIGPPWESPPAGVPAVVIEPGRAFGTGAHPTTRLCIELLASRRERGSLLDVGCGSGVLAIAALRLGYGPVAAVDSDPVAVEVARANAAANGVPVRIDELDASAGPLPSADVAVANIARDAVEQVLARLQSPAAVTAGYLVAETVDAPGWQRVGRRELDGWAAEVFRACRHVTSTSRDLLRRASV